MSHTRMPPVPPANRSPKGPGGTKSTPTDTPDRSGPRDNLAEQGRQGDVNQNTHNQGYQQDR